MNSSNRESNPDDVQNDFSQLSEQERVTITNSLIATQRTDYSRWGRENNLSDSWQGRAEIAAKLVDRPSRVLDLGCGKMQVESFLPEGGQYFPCDLVKRDKRTLVCDFNAGEFPVLRVDLVLMLGVVEYLHHPVNVLAKATDITARLVLSYHPADLDEGRNRKIHGWVNNLTSAELVEKALYVGWELQALVPCDLRERLYDFRFRI